jgi:hypothetical protein
MPFRFFLVSCLIVLGGALSVPAAVAVWQEREIQNEDAFVQNVHDVVTDEDVQVVLAARLTDRIMTRTDLQARISEGLANLEERADSDAARGLRLLAAPLTRLARETINRICLDILRSDAFDAILETAARVTHRAVMAIVKNERGLIQENNEQVVLNLRPVIVQVVENLAGERAEAALMRVDIPEDAGIIVISEENDNAWLWKLVRWIDDFNPVVPIIVALIFLLAIVIAKSKRRALIATGAALAIVSGLMLLALGAPVKELATMWPATDEGKQAAENVYDILLDDFQRQQAFIVVLGVGLVVVASAAGDRRVIEAARAVVTRREGADAGGLIRERAGALRLAGLFVAGVILIVWPEPGLRTVIAVGVLLALYLGGIWLIASDSDWATRSRERLSESMVASGDLPAQRRTGFVGWLAVHAGLLRLVGLLVGAALVLFVWDVTLGGLVLIAAAVLIYLALIEWALTEARRPLDSAEE